MISAATMRRVTPWLVGLYVLALIGGIIPLVSTDSAHAGPLIVLSDSKAAGGELPGNHHHAGDADDAATHHALQDLTGILSCRIGAKHPLSTRPLHRPRRAYSPRPMLFA
jgi:hypothetical protein